MTVYVVTAAELGWDCVVGVFYNEMAASQLADSFESGCYTEWVVE